MYGEEISELLEDIDSKRIGLERGLKKIRVEVRDRKETSALVDRVIAAPQEVQPEASTSALEERTPTAIDQPDIEKEMSGEMGNSNQSLNEMNKDVDRIKETIKILKENKRLLEGAKSLNGEERRLSLVFCLERGILGRTSDRAPEFRAMEGVERAFDVDGVMEKRLVDVGEGVLVSEPVIVEEGFKVRKNGFYSSLSAKGVLAIHLWDKYRIVQFTNLLADGEVEVIVSSWTIIAFYDDNVILLTSGKPLRKAAVEDVFRMPHVSTFEKIGDVDKVTPRTDTSLVHLKRVLCYVSRDYIPYEYNVDTQENRRLDIPQRVSSFASLMGTDCGVKAVFEDFPAGCTHTLHWDNTITHLYDSRGGELSSLFASSSSPWDLSKALLRYGSYLIKGSNKIKLAQPVSLEEDYSITRICNDIFLLYDNNIRRWVLCRIIVP